MDNKFLSRLYLVVSREACRGRDIVTVTEQAIMGGVDMVQLREKNLSVQEFTETAIQLKNMLDRHNVPLIINDNVSVAKASGAYGIHVGNSDIPPSQIKIQWADCDMLGYSIEYLEQLTNAEIAFADYLGVSPVFSTATKTDTVTEWGLEGITQIRKLTDKPLVAIGNMNESNAFDVIKAGADCIAVVSAICGAKDPLKSAEVLRNQIEKAL
ncbi:thiamine phosphate synthase [Flavobacterium sp. AG291]|uniref:thiamine phosphate synthase n=1 Tax=Flavobacterium sp. AG291 TaxID=2184000 RepID=UPI000E0B809D|nr:thiamine phosphate synthase [Flavobacterium sp. AG291]RDI16030.1 thiamine-phosphate diphosphorylase [Flavobacterium sp. AG291]